MMDTDDLYAVMLDWPTGESIERAVEAACGRLPDQIWVRGERAKLVWGINGFRRAVGLRARLGGGATMREL